MASDSNQHPDLVLCVFPHLPEFLVARLTGVELGTLSVQAVLTKSVFDDEFFQEAEETFSQLLRQEGPPFATLMMLPQQVEQMIRHHALAAILDYLGHGGDDGNVTVFLCTGPVLSMDSQQLTQTLQGMAKPETPPWVIVEWLHELEFLLTKERDQAHETEREEAKEALIDNSSTFFSLWDARN